MPRDGRFGKACAPWMAALLLAAPMAASAHETQSVAAFRLTIGWGDEPVFSGLKNSVEVDVADAAGRPVTDPGGSLSAEISFGNQRIVLPLQPAGERPGKFRAWLVPTRSGSYTFHITGSLKGQAIDATSTCSDRTFDCVADASEIQFPAKDPSAGQLAERLGRELPRAQRALDAAASARTLAIVGIAVAALALVGALGLGARKGRKGA
ncbi:MAG TPA: hypothetical protein VGR67_13415 [Candidatus Polarisedimenticolia bacterium]|nr:hypothetical protein [Candidatus Polarisedimenticolia bacterium]